MKRLLVAVFVALGILSVATGQTVGALSSDPKHFVSADNTFYAYVKSGETISAAFNRVDQVEQFDTPFEDITITLDGPGVSQQKCVAPKNVAVGQGCRFAAQTAPQTGIWRIQFVVPSTAKSYYEVSPSVRWGKNLFNWNITVKSGGEEQDGRIWTEQYAIRQPPAESYKGDFTYYYISEDGYIYKAAYRGYNGQISTLSADAIGIRKGETCVSAYQSVDVGSTKFSPALGTCGNGYKLFFEEPSGELPNKAKTWEDKEEWIRPNVSRPSIGELHFAPDGSTDQQSGTISFFLRNFIGQYQIKIDVDNDGGFDGQYDVVLSEQMKSLSGGLQQIRFSGVDKTGQVIPPSQPIGIKVEITKVAEIHFVSSDVEGRTGGLELTRMNGDNAPTTRLCWNDTELAPLSDELTTKVVDGRSCPDSVGGVHGWAYADGSWGNARYIEDWVYASAKLEGKNQIVYPEETAEAAAGTAKNWTAVAIVALIIVVVSIVAAVVIIIRHRSKPQPPQLPPQPPAPGDPNITSF